MALKVPPSPPASSAAVKNVMRGNKRADTSPELAVRRLLHRLGYRFRIQFRGAPGRPDVAFPGRRKVIQVHGCFWHQHRDLSCPLRARPRSNTAYWDAKLARNVERDTEQASSLQAAGWVALTIWECEAVDSPRLEKRVSAFLGAPRVKSVRRQAQET